MNSLFLALLVTVTLLVGLPAHAQVYRCTVEGKAVYQDGPCASGTGRMVDTRPSSEGVTGLRADADREAARQGRIAADKQAKAAAAQERRESNRPLVTICSGYGGSGMCVTRERPVKRRPPE